MLRVDAIYFIARLRGPLGPERTTNCERSETITKSMGTVSSYVHSGLGGPPVTCNEKNGASATRKRNRLIEGQGHVGTT